MSTKTWALPFEVLAWCAANDIELVFTPTNTFWLNWIESEFAALSYFRSTAPTTAAMPNKTPPSAPIFAGITSAHTRNAITINSTIQQPDYTINVA